MLGTISSKRSPLTHALPLGLGPRIRSPTSYYAGWSSTRLAAGEQTRRYSRAQTLIINAVSLLPTRHVVQTLSLATGANRLIVRQSRTTDLECFVSSYPRNSLVVSRGSHIEDYPLRRLAQVCILSQLSHGTRPSTMRFNLSKAGHVSPWFTNYIIIRRPTSHILQS